MRHLPVWLVEFVKLLGGRQLHPLTTQCPMCHQMVRLHDNKSGRRHMFAHARSLYQGYRFSVHYTAEIKCIGSNCVKLFDPRPKERQRFMLPASLLNEPGACRAIER